MSGALTTGTVKVAGNLQRQRSLWRPFMLSGESV
jgi:hypothetical protein